MAVLKSPKNNHKKKSSWIRVNIRKNRYSINNLNKYTLDLNNSLITATWRSRKNRVNKVPNTLSKKMLYVTLID